MFLNQFTFILFFAKQCKNHYAALALKTRPFAFFILCIIPALQPTVVLLAQGG